MAATLKKGQAVRLVQPVIVGEVLEAATNGDDFGYNVKYTQDGNEHQRFFTQDQIETIEGEA